MNKYDAFSISLLSLTDRFFAVLTKTVFLETSRDNVDVQFQRGIYAFATRDKRDKFTRICNETAQDRVALSFTKPPRKD